MAHKIPFTTASVAPVSPYLSSAVEAPLAGLTYVSGTCGVKDGQYVEGTVKDRTVAALRQIEAVLKERGGSLDDVVAVTIYLSKYVEDFASFNEAYLSVFTSDPRPSRTCIGVASLGAHDVEITVTSLSPSSSSRAKKAISSARAGKPAPFLSSAIGTDELVFVSGSCGVKDGKFIDGTVADRTDLALKNVEALLQEEGLDLGDVVSSTVYLSKYEQDFQTMNKAYIAAFPSTVPMGARTCIGVANLPADTDVEITCIASRRGKVATPPSAPGTWASEAVLLPKANLYIVSGAVGDHVGKDAGVKAHTKAALETIRKRLEAVGLGLEDLIAVTIYLSDFERDFDDMTEAYTAVVPSPLPTRTCIGIKSLPRGTTVEIQCTAATRDKTSKL